MRARGLLLPALALAASAASAASLASVAGAQAKPDVKHLPASIQLGEGSAQPNDAPIAIPDAPPRPRPSGSRPWSARVAESVMRRNPQVHRRWDYTAGVVLGATRRCSATCSGTWTGS